MPGSSGPSKATV